MPSLGGADTAMPNAEGWACDENLTPADRQNGGLSYSYRSTVNGSTFIARRTGTTHAVIPITRNSNADAANGMASIGGKPKNRTPSPAASL